MAATLAELRQVLRWHAEGNVQALRDSFGGKPVLLGVVLPLEDRLRVPVALLAAEPGNTRVPGVLLHAQILRSVLNHGYIQPAPRGLVWALTALVCLCWFGSGFKKSLIYWTLFAALPALGLYALWLGYAMAPAALLVAMQLAFGARQGLESMRMAHQRHRLTQAFAGHIDPRLLQRVMASNPDRESSELAARRQPATVMWVQVPQPAATSGTELPEAALDALSARFDGVQRAVQRSGGMVDRFQGTGVLAYFGAPLPLTHHARAALEAALDICRTAPHAAPEHEGTAPAPLRIGIATGAVVTGQAPMQQARPFVVVGDAVQQAIDLAGLPAGVAGAAQVLVSDATAQAVGHTRLQAVGAGEPGVYQLDLR